MGVYGNKRGSSSGGFLRAGNTTLMIGIDDEKVDAIIGIILINSEAREHGIKESKSGNNIVQLLIPNANKVVASGATIFVSNVERYEKF
jgi:uncharacterized protein YaaQ